MNDLLKSASQRIDHVRKKGLQIRVLKDGKPAPNVKVHLQMKSHQFLFGCNCFDALQKEDHSVNVAYTQQFTRLFNYATLPFYWGAYEPKQGETEQEQRMRMAQWCIDNGLTAKGHPLVWDLTCPSWVTDDHPLETLMAERNADIMKHFGDKVLWWDVINEVLGSDRFDNPMSRWVKRVGPKEAVKFAIETTRAAKPDANLIVNDFNVEQAKYDEVFTYLKDKGVEIQAFGIQSHMHSTKWTLEMAWEVCERFARYGWPLHFTELSVLSGKAEKEIDWFDHENFHANNSWLTVEEDYCQQAAYVKDFYTLLFSHPAVEAISWWDMVDGKWLGAPSGLIMEDMKPKPAFEALAQLVRKDWWTDVSGTTNEAGMYATRGFCGRYQVDIGQDGKRTSVDFDLFRDRNVYRDQEIVIRL